MRSSHARRAESAPARGVTARGDPRRGDPKRGDPRRVTPKGVWCDDANGVWFDVQVRGGTSGTPLG